MSETFEVYLNKIKEINSNYVYCTEGACELLNAQQKKIDELEKLTLDNQARYNGALETIKALEKKIDELEKEVEKLKYNRMINEDAFFTNKLQAEKIQDLEAKLTNAERALDFLTKKIGKVRMLRILEEIEKGD